MTDVRLERDDGATVLVGHPSDAYEGPRAHAEHCAAAARWLERQVIVEDLEGHRWMFATRI